MSTSIVAAAGLGSGIVAARTLGPALRGDLAIVILWPTLLGLFAELGLGFSFSYYAGKDRDSIDGLWTLIWLTSISTGGLLTAAGVVFLPSLLGLEPVTTFNLRLATLTVTLNLVTGYQAYLLLGAGVILDFNIIRAYSALSYTIGIITVGMVGLASVTNYTVAYGLSQVTACMLSTVLVIRCFHPSFCWNPALIRPVFIYGFKTYLSSLAAQTNLKLAQALMTVLVSSEELGLYVVAVAVSSALSPLYNALANLILPQVTQARDVLVASRQILRYFYFGLFAGFSLATCTILVTPWLLPTVFGIAYDQAVLPAQILLVAGIFQGTNIVLGNALRGLGYPGRPAVAEGLGLLATTGLLLVLLPTLGIVGAATASLAAYGSVTVIQLWFVQSGSGVKWRDLMMPKFGNVVNS